MSAPAEKDLDTLEVTSKLQLALALAAQGYRVFPVLENDKTPAVYKWQERASFDPAKVTAMWTTHDPVNNVTRERNFNVGLATGRTREGWLCVLDVDVKNGARGRESLKTLDMMAPAPWLDTKRVRTWSGGEHFYFESGGPLANSASKIAPGLDTRGEGGFVVAAGSVVSGEPYSDLGGHTAEIPDWLSFQIGAPRPKAAGLPALCTLDTDQAVERASQFLEQNAELAIMGSGGNAATFRVACRVKDFGLSLHGCCELMFSKWNERCSPPWDFEELSVVVSNAFAHGKDQVGVLSPEDFPPIDPDDPLLQVPGKPRPKTRPAIAGFDYSISAEALMSMKFEDVRWVVETLIPEGLTILAGAPKIGKSWLVSELATETGAGGFLFGRYACPNGPVLMLALEDNPRRLQSRFLKMQAKAPAALEIRNAWPRLNEGGVDAIAKWLDIHPDARLVIIDTLAKVKPKAAKGAAGYDADSDALAPLQRLALERRVAVVIVHHDRKAKDEGDWLNQVSGTLGLSGVADTIMLLRRVRGAGQHTASLNVTGRDLEEMRIGLAFDPDAGRWKVANDALDDFDDDVPPEQAKILRALKDAGTDGLMLAEIADACQKKKSNVGNMLARLKSENAIFNPSHGRWALWPAQ